MGRGSTWKERKIATSCRVEGNNEQETKRREVSTGTGSQYGRYDQAPTIGFDVDELTPKRTRRIFTM